MTHPPIPVVVVGGYLGAGKTTLVNRILTDGTERTAVLVNDFGSVNIDAAQIRETNGDTIELTNGCVCCQIGDNLAETLFQILDRTIPPERILIEASGVADPAPIAAYAHIPGLHNLGTIVLVDASRAIVTSRDPLVGRVFNRQLVAADLIVVTKSDLVDKDTIHAVEELIRKTAGRTPVVRSSEFDIDMTLHLPATRPSVASPVQEDVTHEMFSTSTLRVGPLSTVDELESIVSSLPSNVVRAKGVIQTRDGQRHLVQRVGRHVSIASTNLEPTDLVIISIK